MANANRMVLPEEWLDEDHLMLLECWSRDGYTYIDIANKIGVGATTLGHWRKQYPEIQKAMSKGREIIDYKVENALLKSALGYKTKEVKVTTTMRYGKVVETIKEVTDKEQAPNVSAIQCWLYNRLPSKWKNMNSRANILDDIANDEDTSIHIEVTRASKSQVNTEDANQLEDEEWQAEVNQGIAIRKATKEEQAEAETKKKQKKQSKNETSLEQTKIENETEDDLDYWPDDWEDEDE